jgi:tetratricopeptide (TPR) repeat protein
LARNYGFVHTSADALQQLRFMLCDRPIPADVQILTFRPGVETGAYDKPHAPADLYVVELSSKKLLSVDGHPVQINYVARHFADFFADRQRTRKFWSMSSESQQEARRAWLETDPVFRRLAPNDRDLLARVLRSEQSDEDLEREMNEIADLVGKDKLVFVTHVDATAPDNTLIEQRHQLILSVHAIAGRMGVPCYDPTPLMTEVGQINAMENGGLDLTHYTDEFADRLFADWYANFFLPRLDATGDLAQAQSIRAPELVVDGAASIESAWNAGQLREASQRVRAVLRRDPGQLDHRMLLVRMQMEMGDYEGVLAVLETPLADGGANEQAQQILMQAYYALGKYSEAGRLAGALLADEIETPEILRISADSATRLGIYDKAMTAWKRLFRVSLDEAGAADAAAAVLDLFKSAGDIEGAADWADEVRQTLPSHVPSYVAQWECKLAAEDRKGLMALVDDPIRIPEAVAVDLVQRTSAQGFALPAALFAVAQDLLGAPGFRTEEWFAQTSPQWLGEGLAALDSDNLLVAADRIRASAQITPKAGPTIRAGLTLERRLRRDARLALAAKDYANVTAIAGIALGAGIPFPDLDSLLGRAADALGDTETALRHLRRVADEAGAPVSARVLLARVAVKGQRYGEAIDAYCQVAANEGAEESVREEARRQLTILRNRAVRFARELLAREEHEEAWSLLEHIETASPDGAEVGQEKRRVVSSLHSKLRALDPGNAGERLAVCETILRLQPDDVIGLKAAAGAEMRLHRFAQALPYWNALRDKSDNPEQIDNNVRRCLTWIERAQGTQRRTGAPLTQAA